MMHDKPQPNKPFPTGTEVPAKKPDEVPPIDTPEPPIPQPNPEPTGPHSPPMVPMQRPL